MCLILGHERAAGPVRVNSCIVCGERVLAAKQKGGSLSQAASESPDRSASFRPGRHLLTNICAAKIHPFISALGLFPSPSFDQPQHELISMGALSLVPQSALHCVGLCGMIGEARFIYPSLRGLHSSFPPYSRSAPSLLAPFSIFPII